MTSTLYIPSRQRLILCKETTPGTAVTTGGILAPVSGLQTQTIGGPVEEHADLGLGVDLFSVTPVARSGQTTFSELLRADNIAMFLLAAMMGTGSDAKTGSADPYTHTLSVVAALPPTYTVHHDTGQATEFLRATYGTAASISFDWSPSSPVTNSTTLPVLLPSVSGSAPTVATYTTAERARVYDGVYSYQSSTGGTLYTGKVVSGNLTFSRNSAPLITSESASATDIVPGPLSLMGSMEIVYRGAGANTPYADWLLWRSQGTVSNPNSLVWTPTDSHSISISFYPFTLTDVQFSDGAEGALHVNCSFTASNLLASANQASPVITSPSAVVLMNAFASVMS